ncbi:MAG: hypothetical protein KDI03_16670 [Anaerolineae bacterium]|nr:hypothetical protein [Anaerolineae bacterium]MCB0201700.1 hypothetical protein [Anaerolineae bacterium]MCB0206145.1 hypothetical protein [Anaerolineae bacterium]MCB0254134.1 hypothetical protein [Anaerolineae bacterium]
MSDLSHRRKQNERKFGDWQELSLGGRRYWYDVEGRQGWRARYVKEVDRDERTVRFYQEIYDDAGRLVEVHEKYPEDKGHRQVEE